MVTVASLALGLGLGAGAAAAASDPPSAAPIEPARTAPDPVEVDWRLLASLDYRSGEAPRELTRLDGKLVKIPGFTVPLEDYWPREASEFLLVPYFGACVHTPPPPPNQLVYVQMTDGKRARVDGWDPVWVEGVLRIENTESVYGAVGFRLEGVRTTPYR